MSERIRVGSLEIDAELHTLVRDEIAPGTGVDPQRVWRGLEQLIKELEPTHSALLEKRDQFQAHLDQWYRAQGAKGIDPQAYRQFLREIGYLEPEAVGVEVRTENVDREVAQIAGPQLVVPVDNARYCLNAANARWGSLYDALYGTDVVSEADGAARSAEYNPVRGGRVVGYANAFLDQTAPLAQGSYDGVRGLSLGKREGQTVLNIETDAGHTELSDPAQWVGYREDNGSLSCVLLRNNGLHVEIHIDREDPIGRTHPAGIKDVVLEAAITTIQDCEDSVAAVDAADKVRVYRNWCGLMKGDLQAEFDKGGVGVTRRLSSDRAYSDPEGRPFTLPGRSLLLVRNVGIHMYTDAVLTEEGESIPEGFLDALLTGLAALHDLRGEGEIKNSRTGSVYIVKPKMHGPAEVAATVTLFGKVEEILEMPHNTLKIGIMDEERRTTVNLTRAIGEAKERLIFINTGFLDRTGDEIHTSMEAGPMLPKGLIKEQKWLLAYEDWNVDTGIGTGLVGRGQIGKGMWAMPDAMSDMMESKVAHPRAGASTAWVPSPTAAVLHAMHYHQVSVADRQRELAQRSQAALEDILTPPLLVDALSAEEVERELDNNAQGILGYVSRWVGQGIGCSKVPDINDVGLMEDRATLRISSQHIANWLRHGLVDEAQVRATFARMAAVVDRQNADDPEYRPMADNLEGSPAFQAALDLVFDGLREPNGYTERVLHARRRQVKAL